MPPSKYAALAFDSFEMKTRKKLQMQERLSDVPFLPKKGS